MHPAISFPMEKVCAVVLAGGQGSRMGGVDKGLQTFRGQALALHAAQRLALQTVGSPACIAFNANRNVAEYAAWGRPVWPDATIDFPGPLAGFLSALRHCSTPPQSFDYLLTVPCDSPLFPLDLLERMAQALLEVQADIAVATAPDVDSDDLTVLHTQPVFCLLRTHLTPSLDAFMAEGGRKIYAWIRQHTFVLVPFNRAGDDPRAFANANTLDQLLDLERP